MGYGKAEKGQRAVMDYYFQTEGYSVGYDGKPLIRQIEIGIQKGEILTLIGPNGNWEPCRGRNWPEKWQWYLQKD